MTETPLVSVIIPTYNRADFLVEAIKSVLRQSYVHYEILVANDGSTDDTMERVSELSDPIRYLPLEHSGHQGMGRNQALEVAHGSLIAFLDSDDLWREDKLGKQVSLFMTDNELGLVYSDVSLFSKEKALSGPTLKPRQLRLDSVFEELLKGCFIHPSSVVVRKRLFDQLGLFDLRFGSQEDYHFWLRATRIAPAQAVPEPLVYIRKHGGSLSNQLGFRDWRNAITMFEHLLTSEPLTFRQRLIMRKTLSRFCSHVGLEYLNSGQVSHAWGYFRRSVTWNPIQKRAWAAMVKCVVPTQSYN